MYPKLLIYLDRIRENAGAVVSRCKAKEISVAGVTKGICGHPSVAQVMLEAGCKWVADSRLKNIQLMREAGVKGPFMLLRIPMACEIDCAVDLASATLVSTVEAIELLERSCAAKRKSHGVILMIDVGDLREGILPCEVEGIGKSLKRCRWVTPLGVGTNVGCYGGVLPSPDNIGELVQVGHDLEGLLGCKLEFFSGGSTSSLKLLEKGELPEDVNQLRIGEAILLGRDVTHRQVISYLRQDTMMFEAQVIEVRSKPSAPKGELGADAFGNAPKWVDRGVRKRAIIAAGRQDVRPEGLFPTGKGISVIGASSDHLLLDVEEATFSVRWGDALSFYMDYGCMLAAATSQYVEKVIVQ